MATKNQIRAALKKKKKLGLLPPQQCPKCKAGLEDPSVPEEYRLFREMFSLAREAAIDPKTAVWICPVCLHQWGKHPKVSR